MKLNIIKYILLVLVVFSANSCSDFLDKSPDDELTMEMIFTDKTRTEDWLAGIYNGIPDPYMPMLKDYDAYADDVSPSAGWEQYGWDCIGKIKGNWNSESSWGGDFWGGLPKRIRAGYLFIENVRPLPEQLVPASEVELMKAETRFLIAYYYYLLVNTYGAIPLQTWLSNFTDSADKLMIGQNTYDEIINWIDKELTDAAKILPPYYTESHKYGRATSVMCYAVRARMLLFAASPLVNGNPDYVGYVNNKGEEIFNSTYDASKWERATKACKELIDLAEVNGHKLYYEYNNDGTIDPFMSYSNMSYIEFSRGNKEILFARPKSDYGGYCGHAMPRGVNGNGGLGVTQSLVDAFFMNNGLPAITGHNADGSPIINAASGYTESGFTTINDKRKTKWIEGVKEASASSADGMNIVVPTGIYNMYANREARFYVSILFNDAWIRAGERPADFYMRGKDGGPTHDAPQNGYLLRKRVHPDTNPIKGTSVYRPGILYRLGEAYLNYAEALNESDPSKTTEILKYLNLIRERAGIPTYGSGAGQISAPKNQQEMKLAIKRERRVEMNCEYAIRYDDIRRWKEIDLLKGDFYGMNYHGTKRSDDVNDSEAFYVRKPYITRAFEKKNYWIPIHQNQIDKNPNLEQLPFW